MRPEEKRLAVLLSNTPDSTGRKPTDRELASQFSIHPGSLGRIRREGGVFRMLQPQVKTGPVPENQQAFFIGMTSAGFQAERIFWHRPDGELSYIRVRTETRQQHLRSLIDVTLAPWGEIARNTAKHSVYLHDPTFEFLLKPEETVNLPFLRGRNRIAPFLLAVMGMRLSPKNRLSLPSEEGKAAKHYQFRLLKNMVKVLDEKGFSLGRVVRRKDTGSGAILVRDPGLVYEFLLSQREVRELPFIHQLQDLNRPQLAVPPEDFSVGWETPPVEENVFIEDARELLAKRRDLTRILGNY